MRSSGSTRHLYIPVRCCCCRASIQSTMLPKRGTVVSTQPLDACSSVMYPYFATTTVNGMPFQPYFYLSTLPSACLRNSKWNGRFTFHKFANEQLGTFAYKKMASSLAVLASRNLPNLLFLAFFALKVSLETTSSRSCVCSPSLVRDVGLIPDNSYSGKRWCFRKE